MLNNHKVNTNKELRQVQKVFNGGLCYVFEAKERTLLSYKGKFFFSNESVGVGHYYEAYNNNISVDRAIGVPFNKIIDTMDIVKIDGVYYQIVRMQYKNNKKPDYWNISLTRSPFNFREVD